MYTVYKYIFVLIYRFYMHFRFNHNSIIYSCVLNHILVYSSMLGTGISLVMAKVMSTTGASEAGGVDPWVIWNHAATVLLTPSRYQTWRLAMCMASLGVAACVASTWVWMLRWYQIWRVLISWNAFPNKVNSSFKEFLKLEERFVVSTKHTYQMWWLNMAYFCRLMVPWFSTGRSCITSCPPTRSWNICIDVHIYIYIHIHI